VENDLANFLGAARALNDVQGKKKNPTFKSVGEEVTVRKEELYGAQGTSILRKDADNQIFDYNPKTGVLDISYLKLPYIPLNVYKALLKVAMSVMPVEHLSDYTAVLRRLLHDEENVLARFAHVSVIEVPHQLAALAPRCHISHKVSPETAACTHVVSLYFQQVIFCINVPLNARDIGSKIYANEDFKFYLCPPLFPYEPDEGLAANCIGEWKSFDSTEPVRERQFVTLTMAPDAFLKTEMYDPATGIFTPSTEAMPSIVKLYMTQGDERPNFPIGPFDNGPNSSKG
jgi:hypothetical protein